MHFTQSTYHSKIYQDFLDIKSDEYRTIIRFYEEYNQEINQLEFEEYFDLMIAYCNALFEVGAYHSFLSIVDATIATTIENNIQFYRGEDIYQELLFRKAAACYNTQAYDQSKYILRELIKIDPWNPISVRFLKKCLHAETPAYVKNIRALGVALFLLAAVIIAVEIIFVRSYYPEYTSIIEMSRNLIFLFASLCLIGIEVFNYWKIYKQTEAYARKARTQKLLKNQQSK